MPFFIKLILLILYHSKIGELNLDSYRQIKRKEWNSKDTFHGSEGWNLYQCFVGKRSDLTILINFS
jgi:hypothetical protein